MSEAIPAATVVLVRNGAAGLETLLLRRNSKIAFGGMWVFPGGRIDPADHHGHAPADELITARRAAVREAREETGLTIPEATLVPLSHWSPPAMAPKRFLTWFFIAPATAAAVTIDRGEIHEHVWLRPADALARRNALEIEFAPPTWVTLEWLRAHADVAASLAAAAARDPERFVTRIAAGPEGPVALWHGDAAYDADAIDGAGPRHRLYMRASGWVYERG
ncbi:MAG: NUDIX hydrolase [bacterium]|nr:NUDIX hydrolase [bacterium]